MASAPALAPMNALDGDLLAIGLRKFYQEMTQDTNVLQIPLKISSNVGKPSIKSTFLQHKRQCCANLN
jgi:hypothetical protein